MKTPARYAPPNAHDAGLLDRGMNFLQALRTAEPTMPINYAVTFLAVAMDPGHGSAHYGRRLGYIQAVMSRMLLEIGPKARNGNTGLELVDAQTNHADLRERNYFLTSKGHALLATILKTLEPRKT
jgi:hypothetical protein